MILRKWLLGAVLVAAVAFLGGCPAPLGPVPPPPPTPAPSPVPVPPVPPPVTGRVITEAEFEATPTGTTEPDVVARFGRPLRVVTLASEVGTRAYIYRATTPSDSTRFAEFWIRDGLVVNKVIY